MKYQLTRVFLNAPNELALTVQSAIHQHHDTMPRPSRECTRRRTTYVRLTIMLRAHTIRTRRRKVWIQIQLRRVVFVGTSNDGGSHCGWLIVPDADDVYGGSPWKRSWRSVMWIMLVILFRVTMSISCSQCHCFFFIEHKCVRLGVILGMAPSQPIRKMRTIEQGLWVWTLHLYLFAHAFSELYIHTIS